MNKKGPVIWVDTVTKVEDRVSSGVVTFTITDPVKGEVQECDLILKAEAWAQLRNGVLGT